MANGANRVLTENEIENVLEQSDLEDFLDSGEEYVAANEESSSLSSSSSASEEDEPINQRIPPRRERGRGRGRGRVRPSRDVPSTSGSTLTWSVKPFPPITSIQLRQPDYLPIATASFNKLQYFEQYIDADLINLIVDKTNQTYVLKTGRSLELTVKECKIYIGICLIMAGINYPRIRMYWEKKYRVQIISDAMSRNRFMILRNSLKLVFDQDITADVRAKDKLWRVRPIIEKVKSACRAQTKEQCLSIDEMIIPFTGHCGIRIYCPGKPNPVGIKAYVLANPNGLICDFHIYEGSTTYPQYENTGFGQGEKAILALTETLVPGHIVYCDRYFTSEKLLDKLSDIGIGCTGTIMKNRIPKDVRGLLIGDRELKRQGRGSSQAVVRNDNKMAVTKWYDNKPVILMSTIEAINEEDTCERWCKTDRRRITIKRPRCVRQYNRFMGGVDLAGRLLSVCPNRYRTQKWTQRFISHMVDLSVANAWLQYKSDEQNKGTKFIPQLRQFKIELGELMIEQNQDDEEMEIEEEIEPPPPKKRRGLPKEPIPYEKNRKTKHCPVYDEIQGRCRQCHKNKTNWKCSFCKIRLCLTRNRNCNLIFHS